MLSSSKIGGAIFFPRRSRVNEWQPVTTEEIFVVVALFMLTGIVQRPSLRLYLSQSQLVDHLKFSIDLVEGFLVKFSVLHGRSGHHDGDQHCQEANGMPFSRRMPPTQRNVNQQDVVLSAASITKEGRLYIVVKIVMIFCASVGVLRLTIQRKITEVM